MTVYHVTYGAGVILSIRDGYIDLKYPESKEPYTYRFPYSFTKDPIYLYIEKHDRYMKLFMILKSAFLPF